ncbi:MAG: MMPL family transporter [Chloroflexi bacterium]|nr:MMPL family transporter [Chloroflexota bacterium]
MAFDFSTRSLARSSASHPWRVIGLWALFFVIVGFLAATFLGDALTNEVVFTNNPESKVGLDLLEDRLRGPIRANEIVIVQSQERTVDDPLFRSKVEGLYNSIVALGPEIIERGDNYYLSGSDFLVSTDRKTTLLQFTMAGKVDEATDNVDQVRTLAHAANGQDGFRTIITGQASSADDYRKVSEEDLQKAEAFGIPIALAILVLVFGAAVAAVVPIALAVVAIVLAIGVAAVIGQAMPLSFFVTNMITMIGLAVGIDYSLFIISRYREERRRSLAKADAIAMAGATASRTVLFSGIIVVVALLGMFIVPTSIYRALALGAILAVLFAVLASLTLLPAILGLLGDKVNALRIPFIQKRQAAVDEQKPGGFWDKVAHGVMRRPVISLVVAVGLLGAATVPYFGIDTGFAGISTLPEELEARQGFEVLQKEFSFGLVTPTEIVIDGRIDNPDVQGGVERLKDILAHDQQFGDPMPLQVNAAGDLALLSVPVAGDPDSKETVSVVKRLRKEYIPQAFTGVPAKVYVTGQTAGDSDFFDIADRYLPIVFAFVLGLSFVFLTLVFRSLIIPVKAILMNLLSVGAAYGLIVLIFQEGKGNRFFGFQQVEAIEAWLPLFLFSVLFGLSMDYHVFLLSRIKERYEQTRDNTDAVSFGIRSTGRLITGAALIMVAVFGSFAFGGRMVSLQQMGFGLGVAVLMDATIVRSVLVPASMRLLGRWNWYLPKALHWLPKLQMEGIEPAAASQQR